MVNRTARFALRLLILGLALAPAAWAGPAMVDDSGQKIELKRPFGRIISLYGAHTENLFALGLEEKIIGVARNEVFPPQAQKKPAFSYRDGPEKFMAARPDLVLIRPMIFRGYPGLVAALKRAGIAVVSLQPAGVGEIFDYWARLGLLTGKEERAGRMIQGFKADLAALRSRTEDIPPEKRRRVFFESIHSKLKTFAPDSTAVFALEAAGGVNLAADASAVRGTNIAEYGKERILAKAGEIEVYLAQQGPMNKIDKDAIIKEPAFSAIKAVQEGRVYLIQEQIVSRPTKRLLQGIEAIGRILYPDRFADLPPGRSD